MDCTRTMTQCMTLHASDEGFPNWARGDSPSVQGGWEILLVRFNLLWLKLEEN